MHYTHLDTPIGPLLLAGDDGGLREIAFPERGRAAPSRPGWTHAPRRLASAAEQLEAYFHGTLTAFDLALAPRGTPFQLRVWAALRRIPFAGTTSYGVIAREIGLPRASRAVGAANGANPLPIVVPCHRVIGADGSLTGFGGGLETKAFLLAHERTVAAGQRSLL